MPVARPEPSDARIIAHIDMDCFYVQVEQRKHPELRGLPTAVVQYNSWKGGGLIAVGYEARKYGVKRSMRGDEAKKVCPQIHLVQVPVSRGKADLNIYRNAGSEVVSILARRGRCERASIGEVYLDLTDAAEEMLSENPPEIMEEIDEEAIKSNILGLNENGIEKEKNVREWLCRSDSDHRDKLLACGAIIVAELQMQVLKEAEFTCSAGIAHNKMLAKLASAMNEPTQQTIVPFSAVKGLLASFPIKKMKQLGGKLGSSLQIDLGVNTVGDLLQFSEEKLQELYGINTGSWLWNVARGINGDEVEGRLLPKSHGCGKTFPGPQALKTIASVVCWLNDLCEELSERIQSDLEQNKRVAHTLTLHASAYKTNDSDSHKKFPSKSCPLRYGTAKIQEDALKLFNSGLREFLGLFRVETQGNQNNSWRVTALSVSASKILATPPGTCSILRFFHGQDPSCSPEKCISNEIIADTIPMSSSGSESYSGLNQAEVPKETKINCHESNLDRDEPKMDKLSSKETCSILRFFHSGDPSCSSSEPACNGINQDNVPRSPLGSGNRLGMNQYVAQKEKGVNYLRPSLDRDERKGSETWNQKGTSSILRFFHTHNPSGSSSQQIPDELIRETAPLSLSGNESCSGLNQVGPQKGSLGDETRIDSDRPSVDRDEQIREAWSFNIEEIDPSVIDELPPEIQVEVRGWLRPLKRANIAKRGSSIAHYFSPVKKT